MPIPPFTTHGYLPPGDHVASWAELKATFGNGVRRKFLINGLHYVVEGLIKVNVATIYIDGSFVTIKDRPSDVDAIYVAPQGSNPDTWGEFSFAQHDSLKANYHVDLWPFPSPQIVNGRIVSIKEFFCQKNGVEKGIVLLDLKDFQ